MILRWRDGRWEETAGEAMVSADDRGLLHGLGWFETMLAWHGRVPLLTAHLRRFRATARALGADEAGGPDEGSLADGARRLLRHHGLDREAARLRLTRSSGGGRLDDLASGPDACCWLRADPLGPPPPPPRLALSPWPRNERSPLAGHKTACYAENLLALDRARREGCQETVFLNGAGRVCEAATANLFLVLDDTLATPPLADGCLPGVARSRLLARARAEGVPCEERPLYPADLRRARALLLTNAVRGPFPAARFLDHSYSTHPLVGRTREWWRGEIGEA